MKHVGARTTNVVPKIEALEERLLLTWQVPGVPHGRRILPGTTP